MAPRASRSRGWLLLGGLMLALAGCGHTPPLGTPHLPLVSGARVVKRIRVCDTGANVFCAVDMVVVGRRFAGSGALARGEEAHLKALGWTIQLGEIKQEQTALSPGTRLRAIFSAAPDELLAIDLNRVRRRPAALAQALAQTMFARIPAMAIILEAGPR